MILVIANYRTGSTTACNEIAGSYGYINEDEVFSDKRIVTRQVEYQRLIINKKTDVVIKLMPEHITEAEKVIPGFWNQLLEAAEAIYYTIRLDFEAQCRSMHTCWVTAQWHSDTEYLEQPMHSTVDPESYYEMQNELLLRWIEIDQLYFSNPGELLVLERRPHCGLNAPYTFNKQAINNATWPDINKEFLAQFKDLTIIKEAT